MYQIFSIIVIFKKKKNKYDNFFKAKTNDELDILFQKIFSMSFMFSLMKHMLKQLFTVPVAE